MSATKDQNAALTFNYSNFYHLYRNGKLQQEQIAKGMVLKANGLTQNPLQVEVRISTVSNTEALTSWSQCKTENHPKNELANSIKSLREARKRLTFLMSELDDLLKRE